MSYDLPGNPNPFAPPSAPIGGMGYSDFGGDVTDAEIIRREHIGHEASIKALGILFYLGCFFAGVAALGIIGVALFMTSLPNQPNNPGIDPQGMRVMMGLGGALYLVISVAYGAFGFGLRRLQVWVRWTLIVLLSMFLLLVSVASVVVGIANPLFGVAYLVMAGAIPGYILYLLASAKGGMVFSREYKVIIAKTPHVKYQTSLIVKILLVLLLAVLVAIVGSVIYGSFQR